jgi:hypothetical protein
MSTTERDNLRRQLQNLYVLSKYHITLHPFRCESSSLVPWEASAISVSKTSLHSWRRLPLPLERDMLTSLVDDRRRDAWRLGD